MAAADKHRNGNGAEYVADGSGLFGRRKIEEVNVGTDEKPEIILIRNLTQGQVVALPGDIESIPLRNRLVLALSCVQTDGSPLFPGAAAEAIGSLNGLHTETPELLKFDDLEPAVYRTLVAQCNRLSLVTVADAQRFDQSPLARKSGGSTAGDSPSESPTPS